MSQQRSRRPYLIRAIYDWATDNAFTPHLLVAADVENVIVPREYVQEGRITLNVSPMAVQNLDLHSDPIWFSARFGGRSFEVQVPVGAVLAVFARENGEGIVFGDIESGPPGDGEPQPTETAGKSETPAKPKAGSRSHLRVVK
jgi:stringent starvation protein B